LRSIYFVNPASDVPTYFGAEVYAGRGLRPTTLIAELTLPTLAALAAPHLEVTLCDECARRWLTFPVMPTKSIAVSKSTGCTSLFRARHQRVGGTDRRLRRR